MSRLPRGISGLGITRANFDKARENRELIRVIHAQFVSKLDLSRVSALASVTLRRELRLVVERLFDTANPLVSRVEREFIIDSVLDEAFGLGPLQALFREPTIWKVYIRSYCHIWVQKREAMELTAVCFRDMAHAQHILERALNSSGPARLPQDWELHLGKDWRAFPRAILCRRGQRQS